MPKQLLQASDFVLVTEVATFSQNPNDLGTVARTESLDVICTVRLALHEVFEGLDEAFPASDERCLFVIICEGLLNGLHQRRLLRTSLARSLQAVGLVLHAL